MKFIKLESRGGNYLVVAENIAWLRTAENGQTSVGMMGGQPLLVVGLIEEVAEKILSATRQQEQPEAAVPHETVPTMTASAEPTEKGQGHVAPSPQPDYAELEPKGAIGEQVAPMPEPEREAIPPAPEQIATKPDAQSISARSSTTESARSASTPAIVRVPSRNAVPLWERSVPRTAASSAGPSVKAGSQRFIGKLD